MPDQVAKPNDKAIAHVEALTSVRFLAALSVLMAHFPSALAPHLPSGPLWFVMRGGTSVMFFFVLSGFIMTHVYQSRDLTTDAAKQKYFIARFARIAPLYYVALILGLANIVLGADKGGYEFATWLGSILSKFTFTQALFPSVVRDPAWAQVTWTLSVEFCFYLAFPYVLGRFLRMHRREMIFLSLIAMAYSSVIPQLAQNLTVATMGNRVWYLNAGMYPGFFLIGMVARRAQDQFQEAFRKYWAACLAAGCLIIFSARVFELPLWLVNTCHLVGSSAAILGLFNARGFVAKIFAQPTFVLLGEASYALYLLHGPVGSALEKVHLHPKQSLRDFLIFTIISMLVSVASYKLIEVPARNWITSRVKSIRGTPKGNAATS